MNTAFWGNLNSVKVLIYIQATLRTQLDHTYTFNRRLPMTEIIYYNV